MDTRIKRHFGLILLFLLGAAVLFIGSHYFIRAHNRTPFVDGPNMPAAIWTLDDDISTAALRILTKQRLIDHIPYQPTITHIERLDFTQPAEDGYQPFSKWAVFGTRTGGRLGYDRHREIIDTYSSSGLLSFSSRLQIEGLGTDLPELLVLMPLKHRINGESDSDACRRLIGFVLHIQKAFWSTITIPSIDVKSSDILGITSFNTVSTIPSVDDRTAEQMSIGCFEDAEKQRYFYARIFEL